ncbi:hypothetical protein Amal_01966 [Acetobacter malorum]|uniref:Uncharacterized protein n=1 Tax=Acetobacter malorum TaxID=178901 RepID=A0A177G9Z6_9PROT|nr:hypothetical protein Amal_01966 [Acetobacter malorum]
MRSIITATVLVLCTAFQFRTSRADDVHVALPQIEGNWACEGYFIQNKRPISADISITPDVRSGALVLHHDDRAPGSYHSLEVWSASKDGSLKSSVSDAYGMRWFTSQGWDGRGLKLNRIEDGTVVEQFSYEFQDTNTLRIDWAVSRNGNRLTTGDTILCHRHT